MVVLDGKETSAKIRAELAEQVELLKLKEEGPSFGGNPRRGRWRIKNLCKC